jgi:hypothetical protein
MHTVRTGAGALLAVWLVCTVLVACGETTPVERNTVPPCGTVRAAAGRVLPENAAAAGAAENCFAHAYATGCRIEMYLVYIDVAGNATTTQSFLEKLGRSDTCAVADIVQVSPATGGGTPVPTQTYACAGMQQQADGLLFSRCGQEGNVLVPAP